MKKTLLSLVVTLGLALMSMPALATNGDNVIGVGTISRSMGGVGVAEPQDAITAVFGNPAAMCYIPCQTSEVDFAATIFDPTIKAKVGVGPGTVDAVSQGAPFAFPAIGIYTPITDNLRFGLAAYGISGLGVDYKDSDLGSSGLGPFDIETQLQIMKFAPNLAYRILPNLSVGAALQVNWAQLDLGDGSGHDFGFGTQLGVAYQPIDTVHIGVTYQTPQKHTFKRIRDFNFDGKRDTLALEQPQQVVLGVGYDVIPNMALIEVDGKWINWGDSIGYEDFGWKDQWVVAVGAQVKPVDWVALRAGYNYGSNPVNTHNGFNPAGAQSLQGIPNVPVALVEGFRIVGFPAIVQHHITAGAGINISKKVSLNIGYTHAFEETIKEHSQFNAIRLESSLEENSYEFGLNIMF